MNIGRFEYNADQESWSIVDENDCEIRELQYSEVVTVRDTDPNGIDWTTGRVKLDGLGYWYLDMADGTQRDDFELLDVRL